MSANATAVMGLLVGFLVVGVIGVYIGDQMIQAAGLHLATDDMNITGGGNITTSESVLYSSQQEVIATFQLGVTLCKVVVIVSVAAIVFMLLQQVGLIPKIGGGGVAP